MISTDLPKVVFSGNTGENEFVAYKVKYQAPEFMFEGKFRAFIADRLLWVFMPQI
jgi:hypothetical protein